MCVVEFISVFIYSIFTQRSPVTLISLVRFPFPPRSAPASQCFYFEKYVSLYFEMACRIAVSAAQMPAGWLHIRRGLSMRGNNAAS